MLAYGTEVLGLKRIVAITASDNPRSARLLEKLGLRFEGMVGYPDGGRDARLFAVDVKE